MRRGGEIGKRLALALASALLACAAIASAAHAAFPWAAGDPHDYSTYHLGPSGTPPNDFGDDWKLAASPEAGAPPNITADPRELNGVRGAHVVDGDSTLDTAWKTTTGRPDVAIAVLDSGIEWNDGGAMSDLRDKVRLNRGELPVPETSGPPRDATIAGCSGYAPNSADAYDVNDDGVFNVLDYECDPRVHTDDHHEGPPGVLTPQDLIVRFSDGSDADGNGYVDDVAGWDFLDNDNDPYDDVQYGHGTGEARDSNAEADNHGDLGTCPNCMVVPLRVGNSFVADANRFGEAALYATDNDVLVIQEALGTLNNSALARSAVDYAYYHGVTVIASAADEAAQHHNWPSTYAHTIVVNSVVKYPTEGGTDPITHTHIEVPLTPDRKSYLDFNGCTNFSTKVTLAIPSSSCSSNATGNGAGFAGLIYSAALNAQHAGTLDPSTDCHRVNGDACLITPNEVRQLMASGQLPGQDGSTAHANSPDTTDLSDDVNFMAGGAEPSCHPVPAPGCTDPNAGFAVADGERPYAEAAFRSYPARAGFDEFYGYGRANMVKGVEAVKNGDIPPEAEITSPDWYAQIDPSQPNVNVGAQLYARGAAYTCKVEVAPGSEPNNSDSSPTGDFSTTGVSSQWCNGSTVRTARFDGIVAQVNVSQVKSQFPPGTDFGGPEPRPAAPNFNNRPNQEPYGFTVRVLVTQVGGPQMTGQDRRNFYLHRDTSTLAHFPKQFPSDGASSPALADLDGDNRNELVFGTSDGRIHALRRDGSELPGWPVHTDPLALHTGEPAFDSGDVPEDTSYGAVLASPAVGDIDGDGVPEIVVADMEGKVYVFNADGTLKWRREANPDWSGKPLHPFENVRRDLRYRTLHAFIASPVLANIDGNSDGNLDVIAAGMDRHVYVWNQHGTDVSGFPALVIDRTKITAIDTVTHAPTFDNAKAGDPNSDPRTARMQGAIIDTPAVADLNGDGKPEIVVGTNEEYLPNLSGEGGYNSSFTTPSLTAIGESGALGSVNSRLYAIKPTGDPGGPSLDNSALFLPNWPVHVGEELGELLPIVGEGITGSPVIAPVTCSGHDDGHPNKVGVISDVGPAFIFNSDGEGCYGRDSNGHDNALDSDLSGSSQSKFDTPVIPAVGHPAFGSLGGSGPSFLAPAAGLNRALDADVPEYQDGQDFLSAWDAGSGHFEPNWPVPVNDLQFLTGPSVADVDGQSGEEVLGGTASLELEGLSASGQTVPGFPKLTADWMVANPAVGSLGTLDTDSSAHKVVIAITRAGTVYAYDTPAPACSASSWPRFHHDNANSGNFDRDAVSPGRPFDGGVAGGTISFKAPGDDLLCGRATSYETRQSNAPITAANFKTADPGPAAPTPAAAGTVQSIPAAGLERYFAIRAVDDQGNVGRPETLDLAAPVAGGGNGGGNGNGQGNGNGNGNGNPPGGGGGGVGGGGTAGGPPNGRGCSDRTAPHSRVSHHGLHASRHGLHASGRGGDRGCAGLRAEYVSIALVHGRHGCRFLTAHGRLTRSRSCRRPVLLRTHGGSHWALLMHAHLRPGHYRLVARGIDKDGNKERPSRGASASFTVR